MELATAMMTQLNVAGMGGILGFRYEAIPVALRALGITLREWREMFWDFKALEGAIVRALREKRD